MEAVAEGVMDMWRQRKCGTWRDNVWKVFVFLFCVSSFSGPEAVNVNLIVWYGVCDQQCWNWCRNKKAALKRLPHWFPMVWELVQPNKNRKLVVELLIRNTFEHFPVNTQNTYCSVFHLWSHNPTWDHLEFKWGLLEIYSNWLKKILKHCTLFLIKIKFK